MKGLKTNKKLIFGVLFLVVIFLGLNQMLPAQDAAAKKSNKVPKQGKSFLADKTPAEIEEMISSLSWPLMSRIARDRGITQVKGKDITKASVPSKSASNRSFLSDRPVYTDPTYYETNPSIAVRPNKPDVVVTAVYDAYYGFSWTQTSKDKGNTWYVAKLLPPRFSGDYTTNPVVRYSPSGTYVYVVYLSVRSDNSTSDVMMCRSKKDGVIWETPKVVFSGTDYDGDGYNDMLDAPSIGVHTYPSTSAANGYLYVTATVVGHTSGIPFYVFFRRGLNYGAALDSSWWYFYGTAPGSWVDGAKAVGGLYGDVLLTFWLSPAGLSTATGFYISAWSSLSFGADFDYATTAAYWGYQVPFYLGPGAAYQLWWPSMWPSLGITSSGVAYIAFTADPVSGSATDEDGDICVIKSPRPYTSWTPVQEFSASHAQGYPTVGTKKIAGGSFVFFAWEDHSYSDSGDNNYYDIMGYYPEQANWFYPVPFRITDFSSYSSFLFTGPIDSSSSAVTTDRVIHVIWTDRSDKTSSSDLETDVYSDMIEIK
jgi:hypothetical protein